MFPTFISRLFPESDFGFQDLYDEIKHHRKILVLRLWDFGQKVIRENVLVVSRILLESLTLPDLISI